MQKELFFAEREQRYLEATTEAKARGPVGEGLQRACIDSVGYPRPAGRWARAMVCCPS